MNQKYLIGAAIGFAAAYVLLNRASVAPPLPPDILTPDTLPPSRPKANVPTLPPIRPNANMPDISITGRRYRVLAIGDIRPTYQMPGWYAG